MENPYNVGEIVVTVADIAARRWDLVTETDRKREQKTRFPKLSQDTDAERNDHRASARERMQDHQTASDAVGYHIRAGMFLL